jgi:hypothetical protein
MEYKELIKKEADGVITGVTPDKLVFKVKVYEDSNGKERRDIAIVYSGTEYSLSERAKKNLSRLTGVSNRLINELPSDQLVSDLTFQISKIQFFGLIIVDGVIIALYDSAKNAYNSYETLMTPIADKLLFVHGNPIENDFIHIQLKDFENEEFIGGVNLLLSSTGNVSSVFSYGLMQKSTKLFWRDVFYGKESERLVNSGIVEEYVKLMSPNSEFVVQLNAMLLAKAERVEITNKEHLTGLMTSMSNRKLRAVVIHAYEDPIQDADLLKAIKVEKISNLKDVFSLLTYLSNLGPNVKVRLNFGLKTYDWLVKILAPIVA